MFSSGGGLLTSLTSGGSGSHSSETMVTISANATVGVHGWTALDRSGMTSQKTKNDFLVEVDQVRSLTQFYSVDFSQSRIGVKKCVSYKRTIKVCVSCC